MVAWLAAAGAAVCAADLALLVVCVKRRSVLPGVCALVGVPLVAVAFASGLSGATAQGALLIAAITLLIGLGLWRLSETIWRLLGDAPEEGG